MTLSLRTTNLRLTRHLCDGLGKLAVALNSVTNEAALIKMGQEKKTITDTMARDIEQILELPSNWMDRDNESLIRMTSLDYEIHKQASLLPEEAKKGLLAFISSLHK